MDRNDLTRVNALYGEIAALRWTRQLIDEGARIATMTWLWQEEGKAPRRATVPTDGWSYPPAMVESIKVLMDQRADTIRNELETLGVTNLDEPPPAEEPHRAPAKKPARRTR